MWKCPHSEKSMRERKKESRFLDLHKTSVSCLYFYPKTVQCVHSWHPFSFHCFQLQDHVQNFIKIFFSEPGRFKLKPEMSQTTFSNLRAWLKENLLLVITFSGVFLGVLIGVLLKPLDLEPLTVSYLAYPGELFMRLLKLMILPLIIASLITGKSENHTHTGAKTFFFPKIP